MSLSRIVSSLLLAVPITAPQSMSQATPEKPAAPPLRGGLANDQVVFDAPGDGTLWAATARYKACFDGQGLQFVPFLGSRAPRNFPVQFTLQGARVGTEPMALKAAGGPVRDGAVVTLDRGSLVERYVVTAEGVEQTFVVANPLDVAGDLVVRVRVTTDLAASTAAGLSFGNELGGVAYGAAFLLDGVSTLTPLAQRLDGECIELRVSAATLAQATYPITIDPLVTAFTVSTQSIVEHAPDIAFDAVTNRYFVVWEQDFSASDHDVYCALFTQTGIPVPGSVQAIDGTIINWTRPRCAITDGNVLTVCNRGPMGLRGLSARQVYVPQVGVIGAQFTIASPRANWYENINADVGGTTPQVGGGKFLVVYEHADEWAGRSIIGQLIQNQLLYGASFVIEPYYDGHSPAIARSTGDAPGATAGWPVVYARYISPINDDIWGVVVATDGSLIRQPFPIDTSSRNDTNPAVSSLTDPIHGERMFVVAYEGEVGPSDHDIFLRAMSVSGAVSIGPTNVSAVDTGTRAKDQIRPHLDSDGVRFGLAYAEYYGPGASDYDIWAWTYGISRNQALTVSEGKTALASTNATESNPRVFAEHSAEPFQHRCRFGVAFDRSGNIGAAVYDGYAVGGYTTRTTGCAGLGIATGTPPVIGGSVEVFLQNAVIDPGVMMVGTPIAALPLPCAPCALGLDISTAVFFGGRYLRIDVPGDSVYVGLRFSVQGLSLGSGYPCAGQVRFSNTVDVTIQ